jgi:hypothetical protein
MLTGTALDLTPFGAVLQGIGLLVLLLAVVALYFAIRLPKSTAGKVISATLVVMVFGYFPTTSVWQGYKQRQRFKEAHAHFQERCKSAGEKVKRVVEDADGIVWMKWRSEDYSPYDQYALSDPYGRDCSGESCIKQLLRATEGLENDPARKQPHYKGYQFVETVDPRDGYSYRYTLALPPQDPQLSSLPRPQLKRVRIEKLTAVFGVTWDDLSSREDRDRWIAGSSLKIIDLMTAEVVAERVGYMFDGALGNKNGGRQPWSYAERNACPEFPSVGDGTARRMRTYRETLDFLTSSLKPKQRN